MSSRTNLNKKDTNTRKEKSRGKGGQYSSEDQNEKGNVHGFGVPKNSHELNSINSSDSLSNSSIYNSKQRKARGKMQKKRLISKIIENPEIINSHYLEDLKMEDEEMISFYSNNLSTLQQNEADNSINIELEENNSCTYMDTKTPVPMVFYTNTSGCKLFPERFEQLGQHSFQPLGSVHHLNSNSTPKEEGNEVNRSWTSASIIRKHNQLNKNGTAAELLKKQALDKAIELAKDTETKPTSFGCKAFKQIYRAHKHEIANYTLFDTTQPVLVDLDDSAEDFQSVEVNYSSVSGAHAAASIEQIPSDGAEAIERHRISNPFISGSTISLHSQLSNPEDIEMFHQIIPSEPSVQNIVHSRRLNDVNNPEDDSEAF